MKNPNPFAGRRSAGRRNAGRRQFLSQAIRIGTAFCGSTLLLAACQDKKQTQTAEPPNHQTETPTAETQTTKTPTAETQTSTATAAHPCEDFSNLTPKDLEARKKLGYVPKSPLAESHCSNCQLWLPRKDTPTCGSCQLFKGPVYATAYCTYWAPQNKDVS